MRANHKWGTVLKCTVRTLSSIVILLEKPGQGPPLSFFLLFAQSDYRVLIRKWWLLTQCLLQPVPCITPSRASFCCVLHQRNQRHQWDQYQDWPALPVRIQCSRKFSNSPSTPPLVSHYHTAMNDPGVSVALLLLALCAKPLKDYLSFVCSVCETDQS